MQRIGRTVLFLIVTVATLVLSGCRHERDYPNRPILLICPWAAGGGTDRVSRQVAAMLEQELGVPVNVINATGGAGVTGHTRGALAKPDGYTLTMVTVEINMLHWRGLTDISYEDYQPVALLNRDAAALFVRSDAPWQRLDQLQEHVQAHPGELKASGTAAGGIWHLAFAGWLNRVEISPADAVWVSINGSAPSLQELLAGGVDAICCSLPEAQSLVNAGRVRCLGVMAGLVATGGLHRPTEVDSLSTADLLRSAEVIGLVLAYLLLVETAGFVITSAALLALWMLRLGTRWPVAILLSVLVAATTFQLFAVALRVPLPRSWLGW